jgi:ABC-type glycerol-3-phosphate transport system substrate-binding protein
MEGEKIMVGRKLNRRDFLRISATAATGAVIAACAPTAPEVVEVIKEVPVDREVIKEVIKEVPVDREVIKEVSVEKVVQQTVVVEKEAKPPAPSEPVNIRQLVWGAHADYVPIYELVGQAFHEGHPQVTIEHMFIPNVQFRPKLKTMEAAGDPPEIIMPIGGASNEFRGPDFTIWLDLTPFIERDGFDMDDYFEGSLGDTTNTWTGARDGLPIQLFTSYLAYNKGLLEAAGVPEITHDYGDDSWTHERLRELALQLTFDENGNRPTDVGFDPKHIAQYGLYDSDWSKFGWLFGGEELRSDTDMKVVKIDSPEYIEGTQWWQDLIYKDHVMPAPQEVETLQAMMAAPFMTDKVALNGTWTWNMADFGQITDFEWDIGCMPNGPVEGRKAIGLCMDSGRITEKSKFHDATWEYLAWIASPEMAVRYSVDLRDCLPARISTFDKAAARIEDKYPGIDGRIPLDAMEWAKYGEYWRPPTEWGDLYAPFTDRIRAGECTAAEGLEPAAEVLRGNFAEYWTRFE